MCPKPACELHTPGARTVHVNMFLYSASLAFVPSRVYLLETFSSYTGTVVTTIIKRPHVLQCILVGSDCRFLYAYSHQCDLLSIGQA